MKSYVGQTRSGWLIVKLLRIGVGECTVRGELPPRRYPWFFDNGAFRDWKSGEPFDSIAFLRDLRSIRDKKERPDFAVVPDLVAAGSRSLAYSISWVDRCRQLVDCPWYLAVQDGMGRSEVASVLHLFDGLFVGGTLPWKIVTGKWWVQLAHQYGKPCHVGRVGTRKRIGWAQRIGCDSIDSSLPLWSEGNLYQFTSALEARQGELF